MISLYTIDPVTTNQLPKMVYVLFVFFNTLIGTTEQINTD